MQADESPKWVNNPTPKWFYVGFVLLIILILFGIYLFFFSQFDAILSLYEILYSLIVGLPLVGVDLAETLVEISQFVFVTLYTLVLGVGFVFISSLFHPDPQTRTDEWVFVSPTEIPHDPWRTLVIDLPDRSQLPTFIALEILLRTPVDLSSPSLLDDRTVTQKPIYPNYDMEDNKTMTQLDREELFDPRLWTGEGIESTFDPRTSSPSYQLAPLGYESLRIDRSAFERVLDVARRVSLETRELPSPDRDLSLGDNELPPLDAALSERRRSINARQFTQMKDARMQLQALGFLLTRWKDSVRFE